MEAKAATQDASAANAVAAATGSGDGKDAGLFLLNVTLKVKPERREEFIACIKANQQGTLANEPLAVIYQWGESTTEPYTFHFQEAYRGKAGFDAHTDTPHFQAWEVFAGTDPFTAEPEVLFFTES